MMISPNVGFSAFISPTTAKKPQNLMYDRGGGADTIWVRSMVIPEEVNS